MADRQARWRFTLLPGLLIAICTLLMAGGDDVTAALRYQRDAISHGEIWRLLTGNFVHLGWPHLGMNLAGFILIWLLFGRLLSLRQWLITLFVSAAGVGAGLWLLDPALEWYVGLSGLLHGLFVVGIAASLAQGQRAEWLLLLFLIGKLVWEQLFGALPGSAETAGGAVVVDAHLYGAISGLLLVAASQFRRLRPPH